MAFSVRRSLAWMTLAQGGLFLLQFGASVIVARLLTPYEMGVFAVASAIVGLLSTLRSLGLSGYIIRERELTSALVASVFTINAAIATIVSVLILGLSALGAAFLSETGVQRVLVVMAILPLLGIFEFLPAAGFERTGNFRVIALISLARTLVSNVVMLVFAFSGFSYMSLAYGQLAGAVTAVAAFNIIGRRHVSLRLGLYRCRDILRYGLQMLAISGVSVMAGRLADLLLGRLQGLDALGLYSRASGLNSLLWENVHIVISRIVFVDFSEKRRQGKSLREAYLRIMELVSGLLWPAFAGLAVIAGPLVRLLYGEAWVGAALPLSLLSISAMILVSVTMTWEVFVVCQETARQTRFEFIRAGAGLALFAVGCLVSLTGAAGARIGEALLSVGIYRPHLERMTDTTLRDAIPIYLRSATLTVLAALPAALVMIFYGWSFTAPPLAVLISMGIGVVAWGVGLRALRHPLFEEAQLLVGRLRTRRSGIQDAKQSL